MALINGTRNKDRIRGTSGADIIQGLEGDDDLDGDQGDDTLYGGDGQDTLKGGAGNDYLDGQAGDDDLDGSAGDDTLFGEGGNDTLRGSSGNDYLQGQDGSDSLDGNDGDDTLVADTGFDTLEGGGGNDRLFQVAGALNSPALMRGGDGDDTISGGAGNDTMDGNDGRDELFGGAGNDQMVGGSGDDYIEADEGQDSLSGGDGNDTLVAGSGRDTLEGNDGNDVIFQVRGVVDSPTLMRGNDGNDTLTGGSSHDTLEGGTGMDILYGGAGDDSLWGQDGVDELHGGEGNDTYVLTDRLDRVVDTGGFDTAQVYLDWLKIPSSIEDVQYMNGAKKLPYWIDALVDGEGNWYSALVPAPTRTLNYTFPTTLPAYSAGDAADARGYTAFTSIQITRTREALSYISSVLDLSFMQTTVANAPGTLAFASNTQTGSAGYARYPSNEASGSDVFLNNGTSNQTLSTGTYGALTLIHEIGHALGLKHPFAHTDAVGGASQAPYLPTVEDSTVYTVMSYNDTPAQYRLAFSELDIAALQYLYGPNPFARTGNDTYRVNPNAANFIWDGAGVDTIDLSSLTTGATVYLSPGYWGYVGANKADRITAPGQITVNFGTELEHLLGSAHADHLAGNTANNRLLGGSGNDTIEGKGGVDTIDGGDGTDTVAVSDSSGHYRLSYDPGSRSYTLIDLTPNRDGTGLLTSIERVSFLNKTINIETRDHGSYADLPASMYQFFILAFGGAPGVEYLQQCADAYRGISEAERKDAVERITTVFTSKSQFTDLYPSSLTHRELATRLVANVVGSSAAQASRDQAVDDITAALDGGLGVGSMIYRVFNNLAAKPLSGDEWSGTARLFQNQIAVAKYYTEVMNHSATDIVTLRSALSAVTANSEVGSDAAIVALIGQGLTGP